MFNTAIDEDTTSAFLKTKKNLLTALFIVYACTYVCLSVTKVTTINLKKLDGALEFPVLTIILQVAYCLLMTIN